MSRLLCPVCEMDLTPINMNTQEKIRDASGHIGVCDYCGAINYICESCGEMHQMDNNQMLLIEAIEPDLYEDLIRKSDEVEQRTRNN